MLDRKETEIQKNADKPSDQILTKEENAANKEELIEELPKEVSQIIEKLPPEEGKMIKSSFQLLMGMGNFQTPSFSLIAKNLHQSI